MAMIVAQPASRAPMIADRPTVPQPNTATDEPGHFVVRGDGWRIDKRYALEDDTLTVSYKLAGSATAARLETELNLAMPSCDGYGGRYVLHGGEVPCGFGQRLERSALSHIRLEDNELGGAVEIAVSPAPTFVGQPHLSVSQSEAGFEKIMQATCLVFTWPTETRQMTLALTLA